MSDTGPVKVAVEGDYLVLTVPIRVRRRGGRKRIITPDGGEYAPVEETRANEGLAVTIARAHRWRRLLEEGEYGSIRELAVAVGVDNSYVARQLRLTLLAPDIVEAIVEGDEPDGVSLEKLYRLPVEWEEQGRVVGSGPSVPGRAESIPISGWDIYCGK
jgi:hypothetical protein